MSRELKIYVLCSVAFGVFWAGLMLSFALSGGATSSWDYCELSPDDSGEIDIGGGRSCEIQWKMVTLLFLAWFAFISGPLLLPVALHLGLCWVFGVSRDAHLPDGNTAIRQGDAERRQGR